MADTRIHKTVGKINELYRSGFDTFGLLPKRRKRNGSYLVGTQRRSRVTKESAGTRKIYERGKRRARQEVRQGLRQGRVEFPNKFRFGYLD